MHESFLKIINSLYKIEDIDSHKTKRFLVVVTENTTIDMLRKEKPDKRVSYDNVDWKLSITPDMLDNIAVKELADMIASLPEIIDNLLADRWLYIPK